MSKTRPPQEQKLPAANGPLSSPPSRRRILSLLGTGAKKISSMGSSLPTFTSNRHGQASLANCFLPSPQVSESHREFCTVELEDVGVVGPLYGILNNNDDDSSTACTHHRISSSSSSPARRKPKYGDRAKTVDACSVGMFVFDDKTGLVKYNHNWHSESATMTRRDGRRRPAASSLPSTSSDDVASTSSNKSGQSRAA